MLQLGNRIDHEPRMIANKVRAFKNADTDASIYPEDGNSMALVFNVANSAYVQNISQRKSIGE